MSEAGSASNSDLRTLPRAGPTDSPPRPDLSVVIPSVNGWSALAECLDALMGQSGGIRLEVIVVDRVGEAVRGPLARSHPTVRLVEAAPRTTIPRLRALGFAACRADVVGVLEDHVIVPPDWALRMIEAHRSGALVVGGSVVNAARDRVSDWAAFLCEYSQCLEVPRSDRARRLTGNNVTYRRTLLERFGPVIAEGRWEDRLHEAMRAAGVPLASRPEIRVGHRMPLSVREYLEQRYLYARSFAGMRVRGGGVLRRVGYGIAAMFLPPVLLGRVVRRVWRAGRHGAELVRALPLLSLFVTAWAVGEAVGAWAGAGDALERVR